MTALFRKYRPKNWQMLVGHEKVKRSMRVMINRGTLGGKAFWINGPSGLGKTSIAMLIAAEVADEDSFEEFDAGQFTPKDIDDLERRLRCRAIGEKSGRAVLLNEAHGLRSDTIRKLLVALERIPKHTVWVFTTTNTGKEKLFKDIDCHPLMSRCITFELKVEDCAREIVRRAIEIAETEGLGGADVSDYEQLAVECKFNFRAMLTEIEKGVMIRDGVICNTGGDCGVVDDVMNWDSLAEAIL